MVFYLIIHHKHFSTSALIIPPYSFIFSSTYLEIVYAYHLYVFTFHSCLNPLQSGFFPHHSTREQLIRSACLLPNPVDAVQFSLSLASL